MLSFFWLKQLPFILGHFSGSSFLVSEPCIPGVDQLISKHDGKRLFCSQAHSQAVAMANCQMSSGFHYKEQLRN